MAQGHYRPEEIITKLREANVLKAKAATVA
jgi:hypothetical protein